MSKAVVTAGGRIEDAYASLAGTPVKALARVRGTTMLDTILEALRGAGIDRIAVVGDEAVQQACIARVERVIPDAGSGGENLVRALHAWSDDDGEPLYYATSDLPYASAPAVADFVRRAPPGAVAMAVSEHRDVVARFAGAPAMGVTLAGERVVNGGVFAVPAGSCARVADAAVAFFNARKRPWDMARLVSPLAALRFAFGRLSVAQLESAAERALGVPACAVRGCAPELAFDADTIVEYRYALEHA